MFLEVRQQLRLLHTVLIGQIFQQTDPILVVLDDRVDERWIKRSNSSDNRLSWSTF
jgi:hypothetical protein